MIEFSNSDWPFQINFIPYSKFYFRVPVLGGKALVGPMKI